MLEHSQFKGWRSEKESTKEIASSSREVGGKTKSVVSESQIKKVFNAAARPSKMRTEKWPAQGPVTRAILMQWQGLQKPDLESTENSFREISYKWKDGGQ